MIIFDILAIIVAAQVGFMVLIIVLYIFLFFRDTKSKYITIDGIVKDCVELPKQGKYAVLVRFEANGLPYEKTIYTKEYAKVDEKVQLRYKRNHYETITII